MLRLSWWVVSIVKLLLLIFFLDYDLCTRCILSGSAERHNPFHEFLDISEPGRVIVHRVFDQISEPTLAPGSREEEEVVHHATCDLCDSRIIGVRYVCPVPPPEWALTIKPQKCLDCPDFDTCDSCHRYVWAKYPNTYELRKVSAS
jgi:next to BRCA1 gene 1 protein